MTRAILFLLKIAVLVGIAVWLAEHPGRVSFVWQGWVVETSVAVLAVAILVLMAMAALVYAGWRGMRAAPRRIARWREARRRARGYAALTRGLVAVAAGDGPEARLHARKAGVLLDEPPLTLLLSAQAAQLAGDDDAAARHFRTMLEEPETRFLGLRGLLTQAMKAGDLPGALDYARRARDLRPGTGWAERTVLELEIQGADWRAAQVSLERAQKKGAIAGQGAQRRRALIALEHARQLQASGDAVRALDQAGEAVAADPTLTPAVILQARLLHALDRSQEAVRRLEKAWPLAPRADLASAYVALGPEGEDPLKRVKRMERLVKLAPEAPDGLLALAEAELDARLWGAARTNLAKAAAIRASARYHRLAARLEREEKSDHAAAERHIEAAATAPADGAWVCRSCGMTAATAHASCPGCAGFATLDWSPDAALRLSIPIDAPGRAE